MSEDIKPSVNEPEVREFVSGSSKRSDLKSQISRIRIFCNLENGKSEIEKLVKNQPLSAVIVYAVIAVVFIMISIAACRIPVVPVCTIVIIETLLAACLHNLPIWLHAVVIIFEIMFGFIFKTVVFMILMAFLYLAAIFALQFIMKKN